MIESEGEEYYWARFLVARYRERKERTWEELEESAEQTSKIVRDVVESVVEHYDRIGDAELTTLVRLCQNTSAGESAEKRRERVRELDLPEADINRITAEINDSIGSVGASVEKLRIRVGSDDKEESAERTLHDCFRQIVRSEDSEQMIAAVREMCDIDFYRIQSGRMSPILHYLAPEVFPVVNGRSANGMELVFDESVSTDLDDYLEVRERYLTICEEFDFQPHLRDLDYFLHWASESVWTEARRGDINRNVWQIKYKSSTLQSLWKVWKEEGIVVLNDWVGNWGNMGKRLLFDMSPGDIVIAHDGNHKLLGIGVVSPEKVDYVGETDEAITVPDSSFTGEHIRHVDWLFTREFTDSIDTRDWNQEGNEDGGLSTQFHNAYLLRYSYLKELRWKLASNHREEMLPALETVEMKSVEYATTSVRFFALQTDDRQGGDDPIEQYHFTLDTTGAEELRDTDRAWVIFLEDDHFYAMARIDSIEKDESGEETEYVASMTEYEEMHPVSLNAARGELGDTTTFDTPITQIGSDAYLRIEMGGVCSRHFWLDVHSADWRQVDGEWLESTGSNWDQDAAERFYPVPGEEKQVFERATAGDEILVYDSSVEQIVGRAYVAAGPHWAPVSDDDPVMEQEETEFLFASNESLIKGITVRWHESVDGVGWNEAAEVLHSDSSTVDELNYESILTEISEHFFEKVVSRSKDSDRVNTPESSLPKKPDRGDEIVRQLKKKNQVVFYGPPGTGKTYTADQFAKWWLGQQVDGNPPDDRIERVTFHPSFTYEDFVEGLSAKTDADDQVAYEIEDGVLKRIRESAMRAFEDTSEGQDPPRYVLIVDEINRGNLAQIFGELITLLEADKRGDFEVDLAHSGETVTLPPNLYLVGTMNTADQSIALVDTALRRRFRFIDFPPDLDIVWSEDDGVTAPDPTAAITQPIDGISTGERLLGVSVLAVRELNDRILQTPELGKGKQLGHTYLLGHTSKAEIVDAWRYDILPQLEEYYFGQFDRLRDDLLEETGERLIRWDEERIRSFGANDLYEALCDVAGIDDPLSLDTAVETGVDGEQRN
jgi:hypothetical protein